MKARTLKDIRKAATPEHLAALRRVATSHPDAGRRSSAATLLAAIEAPEPAPAPAPRSPALLAELVASGQTVRVTAEEAVASMRAGHVRTASDAPAATHDDPDFDAWLAQTFGGGGDRVEQVVAGRRAQAAQRTALAATDPAGAQHAAELRALGLADLVTASGGRA